MQKNKIINTYLGQKGYTIHKNDLTVEQQKQMVEYVTFNEDDDDVNTKNNVVLKENDVMKQSRILEI